jgi:hypothetical protein
MSYNRGKNYKKKSNVVASNQPTEDEVSILTATFVLEIGMNNGYGETFEELYSNKANIIKACTPTIKEQTNANDLLIEICCENVLQKFKEKMI